MKLKNLLAVMLVAVLMGGAWVTLAADEGTAGDGSAKVEKAETCKCGKDGCAKCKAAAAKKGKCGSGCGKCGKSSK